MSYKFQLGDYRASGSLTQEGPMVITNTVADPTLAAQQGSISASYGISGSSLVFGSAGTTYYLNDKGGASLATVLLPDDGTIGSATVTDFLTLGASAITVKDGNFDFNIASADAATYGLKLAGTLVTSTAAELNLVDGASAGTQVASKAVIYDAQKGVNTHSLTSSFSSLGTATGGTGTFSGILKTDDTTEATSTTDGSLQTDGGLSVAKSVVIGDDLDLLSDGAILNIGNTSKFTLTDQSANNCVMAASGARLAFGNAGEYISGDGTDLDIISSGDLDITATLVDVTGAGTFSGILKTDDTTEATSTTDGSLQTDGGLSVAKSAVIGDDLDLLSDGAILNIGNTSKFTLTDQSANNCVMAASGARLAFGDAGEYISGDGTDLKIVSSGDVDITGDTDVVGGLSSTQATTLASAAGVTTIGAATPVTVSAAGVLDVASTTVASAIGTAALVVDGGASVALDLLVGDDVSLLSDSAVLSMGLGSDATFTHDGTTGLTIAATPISINSTGDLTLDSTTDIVLDAAGGNFEFKDAGTAKLTIDVDTTAGDVDVNLMVDGDDLVFNQYDGTEVLRLTDLGVVTVASGITPKTNNGAALGTTALQFSDLFLAEGGVINFDNGDLTLTQTGDALVLGGDGTPKLTATLTNALSKAVNSGLGGTTYDASAAVSDWKLDMNSLSAAAVDVALDSLAIVDSSDGNNTRKESIADLATAMAGTGITATNGVFSVSAASSAPNAIGNVDATLAEGLNYGNATFTAPRTWTMIASSNLEAGDVVRIKAPAGVSTTNTLTIARVGSQTFDGSTASIVIESPHGAVNLFYVAADTFVIL